MSAALARYGPGIASDAHPALVHLYRAVAGGWEPPSALSREEYAAARELPDCEPLKAFAGFGCSFGGKYFSSCAPDRVGDGKYYPKGKVHTKAAAARKALLRDVGRMVAIGCAFERIDFLAVDPADIPDATARRLLIYADPPYWSRTGYGEIPGLGRGFDHVLFWDRVREWEARGVPVFVSEETAPGELPRPRNGGMTRRRPGPRPVERLWRLACADRAPSGAEGPHGS